MKVYAALVGRDLDGDDQIYGANTVLELNAAGVKLYRMPEPRVIGFHGRKK